MSVSIIRPCASVEKPQAEVLRSETGGSDERRLPIRRLELAVGASGQQGLNHRHLVPAFQRPVKQRVGNVVPGMRTDFAVFTPLDQLVVSRWLCREQTA